MFAFRGKSGDPSAPRPSWNHRLRFGVLLPATLAVSVSCGHEDGPTTRSTATSVRLALRASVSAITADGITLDLFYKPSSGPRVHFGAQQRLQLTTDPQSLTFDIAECLNLSGTADCPAELEFTLLRGQTVLDTEDIQADLQANTNQPIQLAPVTLSEVATVDITPTTLSLEIQDTKTLSAKAFDASNQEVTGRTFTWQSSDESVATVDAAGNVTAVGQGNATITATTGVKSGSIPVTVTRSVSTLALTPATVTLAPGGQQLLTVVARDKTGAIMSLPVPPAFKSDSPSVATVDLGGHVTAVRLGGPANITASIIGVGGATITSNPVVVTVRRIVQSVVILTAPPTMAVGDVVQLAGEARDANGTIPGVPLTYASSDPSVASVTAQGLLTAIAQGTASITASSTQGSGGATVQSAPLQVVVQGTLFPVSGRVLNGITLAGIGGATIRVTNASRTVTATSLSDGSWSAQVPGGAYQIDITAAGFTPTSILNQTIAAAVVTPNAPLAPASSAPGNVSGVVFDATTGTPVFAAATITLRNNINATSGTPVLSVTTGSNGAFSFNGLPAGTYTVAIVANGYVNFTQTFVVIGGQSVTTQGFFLSPQQSAGGVRIVLSWGQLPTDLDAHLFTPPINGTTYHIAFFSYNNSDGTGVNYCAALPFACLDHDTVDSFGPETITISRQFPGVYTFVVDNFSQEVPISQSGATVQLYMNGVLANSFTVPAGSGLAWEVFQLDGTNVTVLNRLTDVRPAVVNPLTPGAPNFSKKKIGKLLDARKP